MKVLIVRFSSIGDIVLTTPVIRALKIQKDAEVHYLTKKGYASIINDNPYIDKAYYLEDSINEVVKKLREENYDYIIDLHNNLRTRIIKLRLRIPSFTFKKINWKKWLMVNLKINKLPSVHIVERYMDTVKALGVKTDQQGLDYFIPEKDDVPLDWLPNEFRNGFVVYAIGGQHETKKLSVQRMIELCDKINKPIILIGGKEDAENGQKLEAFFERNADSDFIEEGLAELGKKTRIFNGCGKFNISQSASLIKKSSYVFTHDTGMMHIAAAFKKYIFSIWGNTIPGFGMYPYKTRFMIFENNNIGCRPCSKIGFDKCPKKHFKCMNDIVFDFYLP